MYSIFQQKNKETKDHLASIVEFAEDAIVSKDLHGTILSWNKGAEKLFGYSAREAVGKSVTIIVPEYMRSEEDVILSRIAKGESLTHFETVRHDKAGKEIDVSLTISPIKDKNGKIIGASKIARDISKQKRLEKELQEINDNKDSFLAILSHELRNPLAAIRGGLELMHRSNYQEPMLQQSIGVIERQTDHIIYLVEDLMDITLINQGKIKLQIERISIQRVIMMAVESCRELNDEKNHQILLDLPEESIFIYGDLSRMAQVVINLLSNAIKYTPAGGEIRISAAKTEDEAFIKVCDNGIGIPPEKWDTAFEMFQRIENGSSFTADGLGVGLGIAKKLAEMHGGKITLSSHARAQGCEFTLSFRLAGVQLCPEAEKEAALQPHADGAGTHQADAHEAEVPEAPPGKRLLIIDDNDDAAGIFEKIFSMEGYAVRTAPNGETGLELAGTFLPHVCLCDIKLPGMSGYEVAGRLKGTAPGITLIAVSGWGRPEDVDQSLAAGFNHHVVKSASMDELLNLVKNSTQAVS